MISTKIAQGDMAVMAATLYAFGEIPSTWSADHDQVSATIAKVTSDPDELPVSPSDIPWPKSVVAAKKGMYLKYWGLAISEEMSSQESMGVYTLGRLPKGVKPMGCRMVLTVKNARGHRGMSLIPI